MQHQSLKLFYENEDIKKDNETLFVRLSSSVKNDERRIHYRMKSEIQIEISLRGDDRFFDAVTEDISCGGIKFSCNCDIEQYTLITLHFNFNDDYLQVLSRVIHKMYSGKQGYIYSYGTEYDNINIEEQQKISQFILEEHKKFIRRKRIIKEPR